MRIPAFTICEKQWRRLAALLHRLISHFFHGLETLDGTIAPVSQSDATFCGCTAWFVSDPVRNQKKDFSIVLMLNIPVNNFSVMLDGATASWVLPVLFGE